MATISEIKTNWNNVKCSKNPHKRTSVLGVQADFCYVFCQISTCCFMQVFTYINCSGIASGSKSRKMVTHVWKEMVSTRVISFFTNQLTELAMLQCSMGQGLSILGRNIFGSSSAIFGNFRKTSENVRKHSYDYRTTFSKSSEIFGKWSEIFGKSSKTSLLVGL